MSVLTAPGDNAPLGSPPIWWAGTVLALACILCWLGFALRPVTTGETITQAALEQMIPTEFGEWREIKDNRPHVTAEVPSDLSYDQPYNAQVLRTYQNKNGALIMVAIAYGQDQRQEIKVHRPEVCYPASGRVVQKLDELAFPFQSSQGVPVTGKHMLTLNPAQGYQELVTYWIRIGGTFSDSGLEQRLQILREGLKGRRSDGILVRFSQILPKGGSTEQSIRMQIDFAEQLLQATNPSVLKLLLG